MIKCLNKKNISKPVFYFVLICIILSSFMLGMIVVLKINVYSSEVTGESMEKTLFDKDKILLVSTKIKRINRGDIISIEINDELLGNCHYLKRIIGLPNEEIVIIDKNVYINGILLDEPYVYYSKNFSECYKDKLSNYYYNIKLGDDEYFVMGDNRYISYDSRCIGPIKREKILFFVCKYKNR